MAERLTDADLDGIARFGVAIESDQRAMAAELLAYRQAARALVEANDDHTAGGRLRWEAAAAALRALVKGE